MKIAKRLSVRLLILVVTVSMLALQVFAANTRATLYPLDGITVVVADSVSGSVGKSSGSLSDGTITVTDSSSKYIATGVTTVTVTNSTTDTAAIGFIYTAANYGTFSESSSSGSINVTLGPGASYTMTINASTSNATFSTATLTLSNFTYNVVVDEADVTFTYDSAYGSITAGGSAVSSGTETTIGGDGVALVAAPVDGATFLGWIDPDTGAVYSTSASYTLVPTKAKMKVNAIFVNKTSDTAWFLVDNAHLTNSLTEACSLGIKVVLMNNGTLPAGDYIIPEGVTLLIPFDDAQTLYTTAPYTAANLNETVSVYRTLTMASGANITVNGAISLSAHQAAKMGNNGAPCGALSMIKMESNSSITVNRDANLYVWGYIYGSGSVLVKDGGTVYEDFIIRDWRGGTGTSGMIKNSQKVFPISQYYIQNVEVPMTLEAGAVERVSTTVSVSSFVQTADVVFIGKNEGMFRLTAGAITKDYNEETDRLEFTLHSREIDGVTENGVVTMGALDISMKLYSLNSADYTLPFTNNISAIITSGSDVTVTQDMAFLPGSVLEIESDAKVTIGSGYKLYIYDADEWTGYCGSGNKKWVAVSYSPGRKYTRVDADFVDAKIVVNGTVDASVGFIYTTSGGANICSTGTGKIITTAGTDSVTYQATQSDTTISYSEIGITPAKLKNADGKYVGTSAAESTTTYYYCATCDAWHEKADGLFDIAFSSMTMANSLDMNFAFEAGNTDWTGYYAQIVKYCADDTTKEKTQTINFSEWKPVKIDGIEHFYVTFTGIAAKEMTDAIHVTIYNSEDEPVSNTWHDSVRDHAMRNLSKYSTDEYTYNRTMVVDMLNYGAAAQAALGYNTGDLANSELSDGQRSYATSSVEFKDKSSRPDNYRANVYFVSNTRFMMAFSGIDQNMTAVVTFTDHYGTKKTVTIEGSEFVPNGSYYTFIIEETVVADARQLIKCEIYSGTEVVATVTDSIESYARRATDNSSNDDYIALYEMMMKFSDSAMQYLNSKEDAYNETV